MVLFVIFFAAEREELSLLCARAQTHVLALHPVPGEREGAPLRHGAGTTVHRGPEGHAGAQRLDRGQHRTILYMVGMDSGPWSVSLVSLFILRVGVMMCKILEYTASQGFTVAVNALTCATAVHAASLHPSEGAFVLFSGCRLSQSVLCTITSLP